MPELERISLTIEKALLEQFDRVVARGGHANRSEAVRDLIRTRLVEQDWADASAPAVATVTLLYDHRQRSLSDRLIDAGHDHHHEVLATMHVHLDADLCLEVVALRGECAQLRHIAEHMIGMKGVLYGKLVLGGDTGAATTHGRRQTG